MSMISELVEKLRWYAASYDFPPFGREIEGTKELLIEAADAIEGLSAKVGESAGLTEGLSAKNEQPAITAFSTNVSEGTATITAEALQNTIEILEAQRICGEGACEGHCGKCEYFVSPEDEVAACAIAVTVLREFQRSREVSGLVEKRQSGR